MSSEYTENGLGAIATIVNAGRSVVRNYGGDMLTTSTWAAARAAWDAFTRENVGALPCPTVFEMRDTASNNWHSGDVSASSKRWDLFSTGRLIPCFPDAAAQSTSAAGIGNYNNVAAAVAALGWPYIIRLGYPHAFQTLGLSNGKSEVHPCYDGVAGTHIGSAAGGSPCDAGVSNPIGEARFRFQTSGGTAEHPPTTYSTTLIAAPLLAETIDAWSLMDDWRMRNHPFYGLSIIGTLRDTYGVKHLPCGYVEDFEDIDLQWDLVSAVRSLYSADPRFAFASSGGEGVHARHVRLLGEATALRAAVLRSLAPWAEPDHVLMYDANEYRMRYSGWAEQALLSRNGRRRGNLTAYPFYQTGSNHTDFVDCLHALGWSVAQSAAIGVHVFTGWVASTLRFPSGSGAVYPDVPGVAGSDEGVLSVAQMIGLCKLLYFVGVIPLALYNDSAASQDFWCAMIAHDDMQPHVRAIRFGRNFVPPATLRKRFMRYDGLVTLNPTTWYAKQWDGTAIGDDVFIMARTFDEGEVFFGLAAAANGKASDSGTIDVRAPSGRKVTVAYSPSGSITYAAT